MSENKLNATTVTDGVFRLAANGGPELLFESMWPLPHGVSMNSYLVKGEKCAIIDGVCGWDGVPETLLGQLGALEIDIRDIDRRTTGISQRSRLVMHVHDHPRRPDPHRLTHRVQGVVGVVVGCNISQAAE